MKSNMWKFCKIIFILVCILSFTLLTTAYVRYRTTIQEEPLEVLVSELRQREDYVTLDTIDNTFIHAILAIEDPTFYHHHGIVLSNIWEAVKTNVKEKEFAMGGSTITQQLSKNLYLDQRKTFHRKVTELFFVNDIESSLTKDEILELYLNVIYFGDGYYGIAQASQGYFQTTPDKLTKAQATILAGLPQAPAVYQLSDGLELAKQRQRMVLEKMVEEHYLTEDEISLIYMSSLSCNFTVSSYI